MASWIRTLALGGGLAVGTLVTLGVRSSSPAADPTTTSSSLPCVEFTNNHPWVSIEVCPPLVAETER